MSSNTSQSLASTKSTCLSFQTQSASQSQSVPSPGADSHFQRRVGGFGSFGAGAISRSTSKLNSTSRKQHKGQRKPRLADEDAAAESVG